MRWKKQGDALRRWRVHVLGITQRELAEHVGLPRQQISMMESGQVRAGLDALTKIERLGGPSATSWAEKAEPVGAPVEAAP